MLGSWIFFLVYKVLLCEMPPCSQVIIWIEAVGEKLMCESEPANYGDKYAVAIIKDGVIIGHIHKRMYNLHSYWYETVFS